MNIGTVLVFLLNYGYTIATLVWDIVSHIKWLRVNGTVAEAPDTLAVKAFNDDKSLVRNLHSFACTAKETGDHNDLIQYLAVLAAEKSRVLALLAHLPGK